MAPPPPRFHSKMKSENREGNFLGREEHEEGRGYWKDTLWEGEEETLEVFVIFLHIGHISNFYSISVISFVRIITQVASGLSSITYKNNKKLK